MIIKFYEINKINIDNFKYFLFYGQNQGSKKEQISNLINLYKDSKVLSYDENQVLENTQIFYEEILSKSLFDDKKIIIINRATDKFFNILENLLEKKIVDITLIFDSDILEKKSKLRSIFEKDKKLICIPFYADTNEGLSKIAFDFFKEKKIIISKESINLIISKCNGDRGNLRNELTKIYFFTKNNKTLSNENLIKLINLSEDHSISELIDNCLAQNKKRTINILNENSFGSEDCITITRIFLYKSKKILPLLVKFKENKSLDQTISSARPPIFWKDKEIVKQQILNWKPEQIKNLIYDLSEIELQIKKNAANAINIICDFILQKSQEINQ